MVGDKDGRRHLLGTIQSFGPPTVRRLDQIFMILTLLPKQNGRRWERYRQRVFQYPPIFIWRSRHTFYFSATMRVEFLYLTSRLLEQIAWLVDELRDAVRIELKELEKAGTTANEEPRETPQANVPRASPPQQAATPSSTSYSTRSDEEEGDVCIGCRVRITSRKLYGAYGVVSRKRSVGPRVKSETFWYIRLENPPATECPEVWRKEKNFEVVSRPQ